MQCSDVGIRSRREPLVAKCAAGAFGKCLAVADVIKYCQPFTVVSASRLRVSDTEDDQPFQELVTVVQIVGGADLAAEMAVMQLLVK